MAGQFVGQYLESLRALLAQADRAAADEVGRVLWAAYQRDATILVVGNGGSAATASHMACDLAKGATVAGKRRVRALSLTDNVALLTAIGNDISYEKLFTEQLANTARPGDVLVAFSASGNSPSILDALRWAREKGLVTVGILGFDGGSAAGIAEHTVVFRSRNYGLVEDAHLILEHALSQWMRQRVAEEGPDQ
jgi:D-sedoheptulose 7-phosphate isomerase